MTAPPSPPRIKVTVAIPTYNRADFLRQTLLCWSLSKVYTMTGDRFGWVSVGDPSLTPLLRISWMNSSATLPAEWQLRCWRRPLVLRRPCSG